MLDQCLPFRRRGRDRHNVSGLLAAPADDHHDTDHKDEQERRDVADAGHAVEHSHIPVMKRHPVADRC